MVPMNRQAAEVTSAGETYSYPHDAAVLSETWDAPPPCTSPPPGVPDLRGQTGRGGARIIGYLYNSYGGYHKWLMRCPCGRYEARTTAKWEGYNERQRVNCCRICQHVIFLQQEAAKPRHLRKVEIEAVAGGPPVKSKRPNSSALGGLIREMQAIAATVDKTKGSGTSDETPVFVVTPTNRFKVFGVRVDKHGAIVINVEAVKKEVQS